MSKLSLYYFLNKGGKLVDGDVFIGSGGARFEVGMHCSTVAANSPSDNDSKRFIESFAPRKNEGVMPCDGGLPFVGYWFVDGADDCSVGLAKHFDWEVKFRDKFELEFWQPDLAALIKMQGEHDANLIKPLSVGDYVECIKDCVMNDGDVSATKGERYKVIALNRDISEFAITDDVAAGHWFDIVDCEWFNTNGGQATLSKKETVEAKPSVYTQTMADACELPEVGSCVLYHCCSPTMVSEVHAGYHGKEMDVVALDRRLIVLLSKDKAFATACNEQWVRPIDTRTEREKVIDGIADDLSEHYYTNADDAKRFAIKLHAKYIAKK